MVPAPKRLLYIDTEEPVRCLTTEWLAPLPFELTVCGEIEAGLAQLSQQRFEVIVIGIHHDQLPDLRLRKAAKKQKERAGCRVVLIVPNFPEMVEDWLTDGLWADALLHYPYTAERLRAAVAS